MTPSYANRIQNLLELLGYKSLYPPQQDALDNGLLDATNLLVTTPTASGKSLVAMMAIIGALDRNQKAVYLTPLRALAAEKYEELLILERLYTDKKVKVLLSTGDYDSSGKELAGADVIVLTNEKMDSLFRHGAEWIGEVGLFVSDEVHLIGDRERGPTLEMMLTRIRKNYAHAHLVALSATVANSDEIADWLGCQQVKSNWRPTRLIEGVFDYGTIKTSDGNSIPVPKRTNSGSAVDVALQSIGDGGQSLIFAETRKRAVSLASKSAEAVYQELDDKTRKAAKNLSTKILQGDEASELSKTLATLVKKGVGFHHAGLSPKSRQLVEHSFKEGTIKILAATPTLAAGVNLPARRVVVASIFRYNSDIGANSPISVLEYKQLSGRAGRPRYDTFGESIIIAEQGVSSSELYDHYVLGTPEPLRSQLSSEKALRFHLLSSISSYPGMRLDDILELFSFTLFAKQNSKSVIEFKISNSVDYLLAENLIATKNGRYIATEFGKRISMLYIDPVTGVEFKKALIALASNGQRHTLGFLHLLANSSDFFPKLSLRKSDYEPIAGLLQSRSDELIEYISEYDTNRSFWALAEWIEEASEARISDVLAVEPGDMHRIIEISRWLLFALYEVAKLLQKNDLLSELAELRTRIRYGIKQELIPLVSLESIGRVRARALYNAGFVNTSDLVKASQTRIADVDKVGPVVAKKIKDQLMNRSAK